MEKVIDQFEVIGEAGDQLRLFVIQEYIDAGHFEDPDARIPGMQRIETEDGDPVNFIDENHFRRVITGKVYTRVVAA